MGTNSLKIALPLENFVITILQVAHKITMTTKKDPSKIFISLFFSDFLLGAHDGIYWTASLRLLR